MLLEYLQDYTDRVKPLQDQNELFGKIQNEFEKKWENGTFPGWPVSFSRDIGEDIPENWSNCFTIILSFCFKALDADPSGSVAALRSSLPSMLGYLCALCGEICQGPLAIGWVQDFHQPCHYCCVVPSDQKLMKLWASNLYYVCSVLRINLSFPEFSWGE